MDEDRASWHGRETIRVARSHKKVSHARIGDPELIRGQEKLLYLVLAALQSVQQVLSHGGPLESLHILHQHVQGRPLLAMPRKIAMALTRC